MATKIEVGSRWQFKLDKKQRVFYIYEKRPFGRLLFAEENGYSTGETTQKHLLEWAVKLEGINDSMSTEKMNREAYQLPGSQ